MTEAASFASLDFKATLSRIIGSFPRRFGFVITGSKSQDGPKSLKT